MLSPLSYEPFRAPQAAVKGRGYPLTCSPRNAVLAPFPGRLSGISPLYLCLADASPAPQSSSTPSRRQRQRYANVPVTVFVHAFATSMSALRHRLRLRLATILIKIASIDLVCAFNSHSINSFITSIRHFTNIF